MAGDDTTRKPPSSDDPFGDAPTVPRTKKATTGDDTAVDPHERTVLASGPLTAAVRQSQAVIREKNVDRTALFGPGDSPISDDRLERTVDATNIVQVTPAPGTAAPALAAESDRDVTSRAASQATSEGRATSVGAGPDSVRARRHLISGIAVVGLLVVVVVVVFRGLRRGDDDATAAPTATAKDRPAPPEKPTAPTTPPASARFKIGESVQVATKDGLTTAVILEVTSDGSYRVQYDADAGGGEAVVTEGHIAGRTLR